MKKKILILGLTSLFAVGTIAGVALSVRGNARGDVDLHADGDDYTISFGAYDILEGDVKTETDLTYSSKDVTLKTDQNHNDVVFHYDQSRCYGEPGNYFFDMSTTNNAVFYNKSEIRSMISLKVYAAGEFTCEWGWEKVSGDIQYVGSESKYVSYANYTFDFRGEYPNYFKIYPIDGARRQLANFVITLKKDCVPGTNPYIVKNGISYLNKGDHYAVGGFAGSATADVTLETSIDALPVTEILSKAFYSNSTIETINLDNITVVGDNAFNYCGELKDVGSLENAVTIGENAFNYAPIEGGLVFGENLQSIGSCAFYAAKVTSVTFDDACVNPRISDSAFRANPDLQSIHIGSLCGSYFYLDFYNMPKLDTITIGAGNTIFSLYKGGLIKYGNTVMFIMNSSASAGVWTMPNDITSVYDYFAEGNEYITKFIYHDDISFTGNYGLRGCAALEEVTIGGSINIIGYSLFRNCSALTTVNFTADIADYLYVRDGAFANCTSLASITLPNRTYYIYEAFNGCSNLTSFNFDGTVAEWNAIGKDSDWNTGLAATEVVCTDGSVPLTPIV